MMMKKSQVDKNLKDAREAVKGGTIYVRTIDQNMKIIKDLLLAKRRIIILIKDRVDFIGTAIVIN